MAAGLPFGGGTYLGDKSVWARTAAGHPFQPEWEDALARGQIAVCPIIQMELLYSARTHAEFLSIEGELTGMPNVPIGPNEFRLAIGALRDLAAKSAGYHRVPLPDALIAACAHQAGIGVLHYDHDYDRLATVLTFESRWVASPGSIP